MANYRIVLVKPTASFANPFPRLFSVLTTIPVHAVLAIGAILIVLLALIAYGDMLKPGLKAASRLHSYTPLSSNDKDANGSSQSLRRARSAAPSSASSRASSSSAASRIRISNPKYKGLRNTGNTCFFNSTLQCISSLALNRNYLYILVQEAERWDVPTPVIDSLLQLMEELATPSDRNITINPVQLVRALQNLPSSSIRSLVGAHQQQDAHELFALLNEAVDAEAKAIRHERAHVLQREQAGLRALMAPSLPWSGRGVYADPSQVKHNIAFDGLSSPWLPFALGMGKDDGVQSDAVGAGVDEVVMISPFEALLAQRTICLDCGYCEAIRHFSTSEISLSVPSFNVRTRTSEITGTSACSVQECLDLWSDLEQVDWICWNCTLQNTLQAIKHDIATKTPPTTKHNHATSNGDPNTSTNGGMTPARKKRLAQLRSKEAKLVRIIESGLSEDELMQAAEDAASPWYNVLNNVQLRKTMSRLSTKQIMVSRPPRILALHLNRSSYSASAWAPAKNNRHVLFPEYLDLGGVTLQGSISLDGREAMNSSLHGLGGKEGRVRTVYRLAAIVVHYGSHSFGHYIAFKRVNGTCSGVEGVVKGGEQDGWLRISDESVTRASIQQVKQENPYMLFYELMPAREWEGKVELPDGADYATLQKVIAGAMAADATPERGQGGIRDAASRGDSAAPGSLRVRPRTVHRWSTPLVP